MMMNRAHNKSRYDDVASPYAPELQLLLLVSCTIHTLRYMCTLEDVEKIIIILLGGGGGGETYSN